MWNFPFIFLWEISIGKSFFPNTIHLYWSIIKEIIWRNLYAVIMCYSEVITSTCKIARTDMVRSVKVAWKWIGTYVNFYDYCQLFTVQSSSTSSSSSLFNYSTNDMIAIHWLRMLSYKDIRTQCFVWDFFIYLWGGLYSQHKLSPFLLMVCQTEWLAMHLYWLCSITSIYLCFTLFSFEFNSYNIKS